MFVDGKARGLYNKNVSSAYVFHHLDINLAVREARYRRLAPLHAQEGANLVGQRLVRGASEDLELIVGARPLRLLLGLGLLHLWLRLLLLFRLFRCWCYRRHSCSPV